MSKLLNLCFIISSFFVSGSLLAAESTKTKWVSIDQAWVREVPPNMMMTAAYMRIKNITDEALVLTSASSPDFDEVEIHKTVIEDDIARMLPMKDLPIPIQGEVILVPNGLHMMLIDGKRTLKTGDTVDLTLQFAADKTQTITLAVKRSP